MYVHITVHTYIHTVKGVGGKGSCFKQTKIMIIITIIICSNNIAIMITSKGFNKMKNNNIMIKR